MIVISTQQAVIGVSLAAIMVVMFFVAVFREAVRTERALHTLKVNQKRADEFRKERAEYQSTVAEEAARLEAAGILTPHVKASLGRAIYGG